MTTRSTEPMSGLDARFLYSETPTVHMHTMKVAVVDIAGRTGPLDMDALLDVLERRLSRMRVLHKRVVPVPFGLGNPVVVDDPDFDLRRHVRLAFVDRPGGRRELDDLVGRIASVPLPRDRPLWDLTLVGGLDDGQIATVVKVHHAMADGVAAVAILQNAFLSDDEATVVAPFNAESLPTRRELFRSAAKEAAGTARALPGVLRDNISGLRSVRVARRDEETPVVGPFTGPRTPLNVSLTSDRTFATLDVPMATLVAAKTAAGSSLNDAFLAMCGGGLRRYLGRTGDLPARTLVASVPMATRTDEVRLGGNHVDNIFVPLHTDIADTTTRIQAVHASSVAARRVRAAMGSDLFERRSEFIPPFLHTVTTRGWAATGLANHVRPPLNLVASNVPGPRAPLELEGGVLTALYSSGPILEGIGLNITAWSYVGTMYISLLGCHASVPEPWLLAADIAAEADLLAAGAG